MIPHSPSESPTATSGSKRLSVSVWVGAEIPAELAAEAARLEGLGPFSRQEWWGAWWRWLAPRNSRLFLVRVYDESELIGLAPWYVVGAAGVGQVVRLLGDGKVCSDYLSILAAPGRTSEVARAIADWLDAEAGRAWDMLLFEGISSDDHATRVVLDELKSRGRTGHDREISHTWRVELPADWDEFLMRFVRQRRNRLRRLQRQYDDTGIAVLRRVHEPDEFERGFEILRRIHQSRRESLGDHGCYSHLGFEPFLREACLAFLARKELALQWTEVENEPLAVSCGFQANHSLHCFQTAIDTTRGDMSPGWLHFQQVIHRAMAQGTEIFDFLRGDEPYKASWLAKPIAVYESRVIGPRSKTRLAHSLWLSKRAVKSAAKAALRGWRRSPSD